RADGLAPLSGVVTGTTYNVTGLVPGVSYQVYVRAVCGTNKGGWTTYPVVLTTNCGEVDGNFFQGFEGISGGSTSSPAPIHCWTYLNTTGGSSAYGYVYSTAAKSGSNGYYTYRPSTTNGDVLLISPLTKNLGQGKKQLRLSAKVSSATVKPIFEVYRMDGNTAQSSKTLIQKIDLTTNWEEFIVPLPANTTDDYFAFSFERDNSAPYVYLDDIYYEDV